jgi:hypothetical protein
MDLDDMGFFHVGELEPEVAVDSGLVCGVGGFVGELRQRLLLSFDSGALGADPCVAEF